MIHPTGRPSKRELYNLGIVAGEVMESSEHDAHTVDAGLAQNRVFSDSAYVSSAMERAIVKDAVPRGAARAGLTTRSVTGGIDIVSIDGLTERRYRVKYGKRRADGTLEVLCGEGSALIKEPTQEPGFIAVEQWVFILIAGDDHEVVEVLIAQVQGSWGKSVQHLDLDPVILITPTTEPDGFVSDPEGLEGFDDDAEDTGTE